MRPCFLLIIICHLISQLVAHAKGFDDYNPLVYPNSQIDFGQCRLTEPSLVCDPNFVLNKHNGHDGILSLHQATQRVLFNTQCVCNSVSQGNCVHKTRGYPISVVVLRKIRGSVDNNDNPDKLIEMFSKALRRRLKRGQCDEDVLIVYSVNEERVFTVLGLVAKQKLHPKVISEVENLAYTKHFKNGNYTEGLLLMIDIFGQVFMGENYNEALPPVNEGGFSNGLKEIIPKWPAWLTALLIFGLPVFAIVSMLICGGLFTFRRYCRQIHRYEAGRRAA